MQFADPKNDLAFKKIFGDENKKTILVNFLNSFINNESSDKRILDFTILDSDLLAISSKIMHEHPQTV
ncbi:MAG: PD-(D/E)XK nuclease family transposase [Sulfurimonas sp.]|jgi:hypothetical protein